MATTGTAFKKGKHSTLVADNRYCIQTVATTGKHSTLVATTGTACKMHNDVTDASSGNVKHPRDMKVLVTETKDIPRYY